MLRTSSICLALTFSVLPGFIAHAQNVVIRETVSESGFAPHPEAIACVGPEFKLIGGGALVAPGVMSFLTASFPEGSCWIARSKDHIVPSPARIVASALGLHDPQNQFEVIIRSAIGPRANHPHAFVSLPPGFTLTGGGGRTNFTGAGNLLTASFPPSPSTWEVRAKDHQIADPTEAMAFIIGIRRRSGASVEGHIAATIGVTDAHPFAKIQLPQEFVRSGGGARVNFTGNGNYLTTSAPLDRGWDAKSQDHQISSPADIAVFAIGIR